jgi:hypothetical protein
MLHFKYFENYLAHTDIFDFSLLSNTFPYKPGINYIQFR